MFKIVDKQDNNRIVQTFDSQGMALDVAGRMNAGRKLRFVVLPMAAGDQKRADHVVTR